MAKPKYDTVVEAVHYQPDGQVDWVRVYDRRGPTFSDWLILNRAELVNSIKAGKRVVTGRRVQQMASTFEVDDKLRLVQSSGGEVLVAGNGEAAKDHLPGVPMV
jgi:hypothetical protein